MSLTFFDQDGAPIAYIAEDGIHIFGFDGIPLAYLNKEKVYSFSGHFLGWFEKGWLYDLSNSPTFFSESAVGGPLKPLKQLKPLKGLKKLKPMKGLKQMPPMKPIRRTNWSGTEANDYFMRG